MPGLSLRGNVGAFFGAPTFLGDSSGPAESSPPVTPAVQPSLAASSRAQTISARAYGVQMGQSQQNPYTSHGMIATYVGVGSLVLLGFIWWSLPR